MERVRQIVLFCVIIILFSLMGCSKESDDLPDQQTIVEQMSDAETQTAETQSAAVQTEETECMTQSAETVADEALEEQTEPIIVETEWSYYFDGINGAAVIFDTTENCYQIYNLELADTRRSPCSTFKIISSLIALENGIIKVDDSTREWSGEIFGIEEWNRDIDFSDAFHSSCVWYFRQVIDEIGQQAMQEELNKLPYGNADISDWEGLNTGNSNPALTGFWLESSLLISPKEQAEVMENIFNGKSEYSEQTIDQLEQVMLLPEQNGTDISIYGKTGMGKVQGIVVDSWFTGFADSADKRISFCVYLGESDGKDVSSAKAREIAMEIMSDYLDRSIP